MATASVLQLPELLEGILVNLKLKALLFAQRVNKVCRSAVVRLAPSLTTSAAIVSRHLKIPQAPTGSLPPACRLHRRCTHSADQPQLATDCSSLVFGDAHCVPSDTRPSRIGTLRLRPSYVALSTAANAGSALYGTLRPRAFDDGGISQR